MSQSKNRVEEVVLEHMLLDLSLSWCIVAVVIYGQFIMRQLNAFNPPRVTQNDLVGHIRPQALGLTRAIERVITIEQQNSLEQMLELWHLAYRSLSPTLPNQI